MSIIRSLLWLMAGLIWTVGSFLTLFGLIHSDIPAAVAITLGGLSLAQAERSWTDGKDR